MVLVGQEELSAAAAAVFPPPCSLSIPNRVFRSVNDRSCILQIALPVVVLSLDFQSKIDIRH